MQQHTSYVHLIKPAYKRVEKHGAANPTCTSVQPCPVVAKLERIPAATEYVVTFPVQHMQGLVPTMGPVAFNMQCIDQELLCQVTPTNKKYDKLSWEDGRAVCFDFAKDQFF